jgi:hypothetical protein
MKTHRLTISLLLLSITAVNVAFAADHSPLPEAGGAKFLANYTNREQQKLPADGIYPLGQRMPISAYSTNAKQLREIIAAGFTMDGPHYHGESGPPRWRIAQKAGLKGWFRLRIHDYQGNNGWRAVLPQMTTPEGRASLERQIKEMVNSVQTNPAMNDYIAAWYSHPEEPMSRKNWPWSLDDQLLYLRLVHKVVQNSDKLRRPLYVSERGDSAYWLMINNQCGIQDGSLKQNYLVKGNAYNGGDNHERVIMWRWARDVVETARDADKKCPSYTGRPRAAIATLSSYIDPDNASERNVKWLRKIITYDTYVSLAAGVDGLVGYSFGSGGKTKAIQQKLYREIWGKISRSDLGKVFLWGKDRDDIKMEIIEGPKTITWKKYSNEYTAPSIFMRNIQYGDNRYIILTNNSKQIVRPKLSGFPAGLYFLDIVQNAWYSPNTTITPTIHPLGVRIYKIAELPPSSIKPYSRSPM